MDNPDFDVIIVGGGPAGATLAYFLMKYVDEQGVGKESLSRIKVMLVERHDGKEYDSYHHKCGEGISKKGLDIIKPRASIVREIHEGIEHWGNAPDSKITFNLFIIDRSATFRSMLDDFIARGGGITRDVFLAATKHPEGNVLVKLESGRTVTCRLLVGADGPNSRVRKVCGFGSAKLTTVEQYLIPCKENMTFIEMWYDKKYKGVYKYRFPAENGRAKIGYIHGTEEYKEEIIAIQARPVAWGGLETYYKDGVVLIGDAAAQCNPITGGGMRVAFVAAKKLASSLASVSVIEQGEKRSAAFKNAASLFSHEWKKTPYESGKYIRAHEAFENMTTAELESFSEPLRKNPLSIILKAKWWWLYRAFINSDKYAW
nr:NAD(P)/FAD-dependent oxidoreductase [Candidatus Sigynarchaeota archaeon]